jgi:hypothetical protein
MSTKKKPKSSSPKPSSPKPVQEELLGGVTTPVEELQVEKDELVLPEQKYEVIRKIRAEMDSLVPRIAELGIKAQSFKTMHDRAINDFIELDQKLNESIRIAASENGIQLDGQSWNFNIQSLTFKKVQ